MKEIDKFFVINKFDEGWNMENQLFSDYAYDYCLEVLYIPEEFIENISMYEYGMEIYLCDIEFEDTEEDWYVNLIKQSVSLSKLEMVS